jgi:hypothetical protein
MPDRTRLPRLTPVTERVMLSSAGSSTTTAGALASSTWLRNLGLTPPLGAWRADLELMSGTRTRFSLEIEHNEWGFVFTHGERSSWIRVTTLPFVHDQDDFGLLSVTPPLRDIGKLVRRLESTYEIMFRRSHASIQTTLPGLVPEALRWLARL